MTALTYGGITQVMAGKCTGTFSHPITTPVSLKSILEVEKKAVEVLCEGWTRRCL